MLKVEILAVIEALLYNQLLALIKSAEANDIIIIIAKNKKKTFFIILFKTIQSEQYEIIKTNKKYINKLYDTITVNILG